MNLPTLTELSTKELLAMRDRTEKRIEADSAYVMRRLQETDDLRRMVALIQQELDRRNR